MREALSKDSTLICFFTCEDSGERQSSHQDSRHSLLCLHSFLPSGGSWMTVRLPARRKHFPHSSNDSSSPVWILQYQLRCAFVMELFPHPEHIHGFSHLRITGQKIKFDLKLKLFLHSEHLYDFYVNYLMKCDCLQMTLLPHSKYLFHFSRVDTLMGIKVWLLTETLPTH